ncbi:hypothetical protein ACFVZD_27330 [Streptomyces sp. NPDC058287]|uniref:hypothetical protein n=1 Tax=Streptomyces sp. NPDC058287 TaxID=3346423 RepID=UPI0036E96AA6
MDINPNGTLIVSDFRCTDVTHGPKINMRNHDPTVATITDLCMRIRRIGQPSTRVELPGRRSGPAGVGKRRRYVAVCSGQPERSYAVRADTSWLFLGNEVCLLACLVHCDPAATWPVNQR